MLNLEDIINKSKNVRELKGAYAVSMYAEGAETVRICNSPYAVILSVCSPTALRNVRIPGCSGSSHTEAGIIPEFCLPVRRSYGNHDL